MRGNQLPVRRRRFVLGVHALGDIPEVAADVIDSAVQLITRLGGDPDVVPLARPALEPQHQVVSLADLAGLAELFLGQISIVLVKVLSETLVESSSSDWPRKLLRLSETSSQRRLTAPDGKSSHRPGRPSCRASASTLSE